MIKSFEGWTVLIVDNEVDNVVVTSKILSFHGAKVLTASGGAEALDIINKTPPTLLLLDLSMPQMDGWEVLRRIKAKPETAKLPVIALTAHAMLGDRERVMEAGFNGYIAKPFEISGLVNSIKDVMSKLKA